MGLKGFRLWVMGQLDSTCAAPPLVFLRSLAAAALAFLDLGFASM
jgi:hypothetical protein